MQFTEKELKEDFVLFCEVIWYYLDLPPLTRVQKLIAEFMADSSKRDRMIQAYRGGGKSYLAYAYCLWRIWKNPDIKILALSASSSRADAFSETCQRILLITPFLQHLIPTGRDTTWTKKTWSVTGTKASGSQTVTSKGITGQITGSRADLIILDDIEISNNAGTVEQRAKLRDQVREVDAIRKGNERGEGHEATSEVLVLGTPQSFESIYVDMYSGGYDCRIWPVLYPDLDSIDGYRGNLCPVLAEETYKYPEKIGSSTDPLRFTATELEARRARYGRSGFALQFMLDTSLSDAEKFPLKLSDLIVYDTPANVAPVQLGWSKDKRYNIQDLPSVGFSGDRYNAPNFISEDNMQPFENAIMAIDPSGRGKDETTYVILKSLMGTLHLVDAGGFSEGYDEKQTLLPLALLAKEHQVSKVYLEANYGGGMFSELLKPILYGIHPCIIEEVNHHTNKERRIIDTLEPVMSRHKLVVSRYVIEKDYKTSFLAKDKANGKPKDVYSLFYQMTHINYDKGCLVHDDRLDALAIGVASFLNVMNRDIDFEIGRLADEKFENTMRYLRDRRDKSITRLGTAHNDSLGHLSGVTEGSEYNILDSY